MNNGIAIRSRIKTPTTMPTIFQTGFTVVFTFASRYAWMNQAGHADAVDELKLRDPHHDFVTADWMHMPARRSMHSCARKYDNRSLSARYKITIIRLLDERGIKNK
jgi:hypothetical protein